MKRGHDKVDAAENESFPTVDELRELAQTARERKETERFNQQVQALKMFQKIFAKSSRIYAMKGSCDWRESIQTLRDQGVFRNPAREGKQIEAIVADLNEQGFNAVYESNVDNEYLPAIHVSWDKKKSKKR